MAAKIIGIYNTNSLEAGVCRLLSRVNHSCAPAAVRNIEPTTGTLSLIAARDIEKGEEITIKVEEN